MRDFPLIYRRLVSQFLHAIVLPVFFFTFMLIQRPVVMLSTLGNEWFGVHLTIMSCIILLCIILLRALYYFLPLKLNYTLYTYWCLAEIVMTAFFVALYLWIVLKKPMPYFDMLIFSFKNLFFVLPLAYVILALSLSLYEIMQKSKDDSDSSPRRMRFYDSYHNLRIVLSPQTVLCIAADENYVTIYYMENHKVKEYVLRSSMKALDELCQENGLVRCHRSYYINPSHVKLLRKDKEGIMYAELDADDVRHIPVSKKYYVYLSEML